MSTFRDLDPVLHSQLRLSLMALLIGTRSASFVWLVEQTGATKGNVSVQLKKLEEAGYIDISKSFRDNYPHTDCRVTAKGVEAFKLYIDTIRDYLDPPINL